MIKKVHVTKTTSCPPKCVLLILHGDSVEDGHMLPMWGLHFPSCLVAKCVSMLNRSPQGNVSRRK